MGCATGVLARLLIFSTVGSGPLLAGQIYWTDRGYNDPNGPSIRRGEIDGSGSEILLDATDGLSQLRGIGLDVAGGKVYWNDTDGRSVNRGRMDGIGPLEILYYDPLYNPWDLELVLDAIPEPLLGDVNLDGEVNGLDVDPFVDVLLSGPCQPEADVNLDAVVNGLDVDSFVAAVVGGSAQEIPEPSTLLLGIIALGVVGGWRKGGALFTG